MTPNSKQKKRVSIKIAKEFADTLVKEKNAGLIVVTFISINTGMRRSEILGLTWNDIDLKDKLIFQIFS